MLQAVIRSELPSGTLVWSPPEIVIACRRTQRSNTPFIDERTGKRSWTWPMTVAWECVSLADGRIKEHLLDDADRARLWRLV